MNIVVLIVVILFAGGLVSSPCSAVSASKEVSSAVNYEEKRNKQQ
jgi:hypothetical protein